MVSAHALNFGFSALFGNQNNIYFTISCFVTWVSFFLLFLAFIEPSFRGSFFDFQSGKEFTVAKFDNRANVPEEESIDIFTVTTVHWEHKKPEIKVWLAENWKDWEVRRPGWFNSEFIDNMYHNHKDLLPPHILEMLEEAEYELSRDNFEAINK